MLRRGGHLHTIAPLLRMSVLAMLLLSCSKWINRPFGILTQGDRVVIALVSNEDTQVHLHAYDLKLQLEAGVPAELAFEAHHSGRFPAALHWPADGGHREDRALLYLEVYPQ